MTHFFRRFARDEDGAVTVDFVVLTAALIFMVMGVFTIITPAAHEEAAASINDKVLEAASR
jgi:Flp pilus assembly pilin Flp